MLRLVILLDAFSIKNEINECHLDCGNYFGNKMAFLSQMTLLNECLMEETYKNPQGVKHVKLDVLTMGFLSVGEGGEA